MYIHDVGLARKISPSGRAIKFGPEARVKKAVRSMVESLKWVCINELIDCIPNVRPARAATNSFEIKGESLFEDFGLLMEESVVTWPNNDPGKLVSYNYIDTKRGIFLDTAAFPRFDDSENILVTERWATTVLDFMSIGMNRVERDRKFPPYLLAYFDDGTIGYVNRVGRWGWKFCGEVNKDRLAELSKKKHRH